MEHEASNLGVGGSNPSRRASDFAALQVFLPPTLFAEPGAPATASSIDPVTSIEIGRRHRTAPGATTARCRKGQAAILARALRRAARGVRCVRVVLPRHDASVRGDEAICSNLGILRSPTVLRDAARRRRSRERGRRARRDRRRPRRTHTVSRLESFFRTASARPGASAARRTSCGTPARRGVSTGPRSRLEAPARGRR